MHTSNLQRKHTLGGPGLKFLLTQLFVSQACLHSFHGCGPEHDEGRERGEPDGLLKVDVRALRSVVGGTRILYEHRNCATCCARRS